MNEVETDKQDVVIATAYSWPESLHKKIQTHQRRMALKWNRKVNFDEAISHYVQNTKFPTIAPTDK